MKNHVTDVPHIDRRLTADRAARRKNTVVTLECGCTVRAFHDNIGRGARFACESNLGHGYRVPWISSVNENGFIRTNTL